MSLQAAAPRVILASASQARQALLASAGLRFEVMAAEIDETEIKRSARAEGVEVEDTALLLAELKARRIARLHPDALVIAADQLLVCDDRWFDKPVDLADARAHLRALRGRMHTLVTGVVCHQGDQLLWHHVARPHMTMRRFSDAFLSQYLEAEAERVTTTVGAYRLEGPGVQLFDEIDGEHSAILGLPLLPLLGFLRQHGVILD